MLNFEEMGDIIQSLARYLRFESESKVATLAGCHG